jgi:hypothetical protein
MFTNDSSEQVVKAPVTAGNLSLAVVDELHASSTATIPEALASSSAGVVVALNDNEFNEIVRRISEPKRIVIEAALARVTAEHIDSLLAAMANQKNLLKDDSFIHNEIFPFAALQAVRTLKISPHQFATLMALWGSLDVIIPKPFPQSARAMPEFVPLFTDDGAKNPNAEKWLLNSFEPSPSLTNLVAKTPDALLNAIYDKAVDLPQSEQGFWVVDDSTRHSSAIGQTVTQRIKALGVRFLAFGADNKLEMIPSFGLQQLFLDAAFPHAVRINPVIGDSSPIDIRNGSLNRYRDIALPFPDNELPKVADDFPAPSPLDFMFHDRYHAIRASRVTPKETAYYVAIGDHLNKMQERYDSIVKQFNERHTQHKALLPEFGQAVAKLPADKQREVTEEVLKKFNHEIAIINKLKKMRKSNGQLKFRLWDMERALSGSVADTYQDNALKELLRIIGNIELDLQILAESPNTIGLSKYSGRKVAHAVLNEVKPDAAKLSDAQFTLRETYEMFRAFSLFMPIPPPPPGQKAFDEAIIDADIKQFP